MQFVLYSAHELVASDGSGFWSNAEGWVEFRAATRFTVATVPSCNMPLSTGRDAKWIMWDPVAHDTGYGALDQVQINLPLAVN